MPSATETPVKAYAHCVNSRCPGNTQVAVDAIAVETFYSFQDTGGDGMFAHPERSMIHLRYADVDESKCEYCGSNRDLSAEPRMQLDDSGYDRMALLDIAPEQRVPDAFNEGSSPGGHVVIDDTRTTKLEEENRELRESLAELRGMILGQQSVTQPQAPAEPAAEVEPEGEAE